MSAVPERGGQQYPARPCARHWWLQALTQRDGDEPLCARCSVQSGRQHLHPDTQTPKNSRSTAWN